MSKDGTKFVCQMCGKEFKSLAHHIKVHNLKPWEYLIKYNLPGFTDIVGNHIGTKSGSDGPKIHFGFFRKRKLTQ